MAYHVCEILLFMLLLLLNLQDCDSLCDTCYVTRLSQFDNILIEDRVVWKRSVTNNGVCFRLCYADFRCVSFQYNPDTGTCRGMATTFTSPATVNTSSEQGVRLYVPCSAANRYGASCTSNSDCHVTNTECIDGICKCRSGLVLSPSSYMCVEGYVLEYIGCFQDNVTVRMFPYGYFRNESMTLDVCADYCITHGHIYTATQYSFFCFCGDTIAEGYEKRDESECNMACGGNADQICGGSTRNSVYRNRVN